MTERELQLIRIAELEKADSHIGDITQDTHEIPVDKSNDRTGRVQLSTIARKIITYITEHIVNILPDPIANKFLGADQYGNLVWKDVPTQQNADWNATEGYSKILNKPNLKRVATTGDYDDLINKPTIPPAQIQADWNQLDATNKSFIKNKPNLHSVATSGNYNDLSNRPSNVSSFINDAEYLTANSQVIKGKADKSSLADVATSGDYNDLDNIPTDLSNFTNIAGYLKEADVTGILQRDLKRVAFTGSYNDLDNKPDMSDYATKSGDIASILAMIQAIGKPLTWIGALTPAEIAALQNVKEGSVYTCTTDGMIGTLEVEKDEEVAWNGTEWFSIGKGDIDLSNYYTKGEIDAMIPAAQVQSDWNEADQSSKAFIQNKPTLFSGNYNDLSNKPTTLSEFTDDVGYLVAADIAGKANTAELATVATSGDYEDLTNKPHIPNDQVQADWNQSNSNAVDFIKNKPNLKTVATSGDYEDLTNKPTIPTLVQSDWSEDDPSDDSYIKNKPSLATVATTGNYSDLIGKPNIPDDPVQSDWTDNDNTHQAYIKNKPNLKTVATSGDYEDLTNKPHIPVIGFEEL